MPRTSDTALSVGYADNALTGNGLQEQRFLDRDYASVYTMPDQTDNRVDVPQSDDAARLEPHADASAATSTTATSGRTRSTATSTTIRSISPSTSPAPPNSAPWRPRATRGFPTSGATAANTPFPFWRCIANVLLNDEPGEKCNGLLNRSHTVQHNYGVSGQVTWRDWLTARNALTIGAAYDGSRSSFEQSTQLGYLNPDRTSPA